MKSIFISIFILINGLSIFAQNAYITSNDGKVSVINTATDMVVATITTPGNAYGVCVSPDGKRVYVGYQIDNKFTIINTANNTIINTYNLSGSAQGIVVSP
ncbi:MAG TPA: hypothetical protein PKC41_12675, partial [Chitinophagaceae bacterium]|nr:hypothetical protein [Chitinophagaceae bacterium]